MNLPAISFNLICHIQFSVFSVFRIFRPIRKRKSGFLGTVGILRSSPIRRYPVDVCRCPGWATIRQNGKTGFPALARSGVGNLEFNATRVILRSSLIRGYPYHVCRCLDSAQIRPNGRDLVPGSLSECNIDIEKMHKIARNFFLTLDFSLSWRECG